MDSIDAAVITGMADSPATQDRGQSPERQGTGQAGMPGSPPRGDSGQRMFSLDILRGVAIWLVLIRHMPLGSGTSESLLARALLLVNQIGWCGVDLFFVLSGYLISGLLFKELQREGTIDLPRFWLRRGLKIWPSYFAVYGSAVALWCGYCFWRGNMEEVSRMIGEKLVPNLVFIQNYFIESQWPHSWSLAVEEHFYLLLPILILALASLGGRFDRTAGGRRPYGLIPIAVAVAVGILALRIRAVAAGASWADLYYPTHHRADSLFFGVLLRFVSHYRSPIFDRLLRAGPLWLLGLPLALAIPLLFPLEESGWLTGTVGFTALYLSFGGLVFLAGANPDFGRGGAGPLTLLARGLAWSGVYSYTIYLAHSVVNSVYAHGVIKETGPADAISFLVLSIAGGVVASHVVERPFLRCRERWVPSRRPAALAHPSRKVLVAFERSEGPCGDHPVLLPERLGP
jgi:peptidoglycan/LPS O-acetylase OafA/YrhL